MSEASIVQGVDLSSQVSVAVARKALDVARQQGASEVKMIQAAAQAAKSAGGATANGRLDVYA